MSKAFYVNLNACTGCKACQVACKDKWNLPVGRTWRRVAEYTGGTWVQENGTFQQNVFAYYVSVACNHCENPACIEACPAQAIMKRPDGIVVINQQDCIGCRYCEWACPYGAPQFDAEIGKMSKCNFCYDAIDAGESPACVGACPVRALDYGELSDLQAKYGTVRAVEPMPDPNITRPSVVLSPHKDSQMVGSGTGQLSNPEEV
ncbi:MAG: dimethylsulfoxide reductase subunit B [Anaerolineae bacterium]|nr:dimethylsulfoxide reductase subunit B [Anaerolineae bacterium]